MGGGSQLLADAPREASCKKRDAGPGQPSSDHITRVMFAKVDAGIADRNRHGKNNRAEGRAEGGGGNGHSHAVGSVAGKEGSR